MQNNGLVSIIMPNYNCVEYIVETIKSVQNQTYPFWEMLVVDDCSTDGSWDYLNELARQDSRIKVLRNAINSGAAVSRNYGLREAQGKWIAFLDSDDLWSPCKLEKQIRFMLNNNYKFSYTNSENIGDNGESLGTIDSGPKIVGYYKLLFYNFLSTCSVMYDKELIGLIQIPNLKKRNDYAMWLQVAKITPCFLLNETLTKYRIRKSGSLSGKSRGMFAQRSLLKNHYEMFRKNESFNPILATIFVSINVLGYFYKKFFYIKKSKA